MPKWTLERRLHHITDELSSQDYKSQALYNNFAFDNENSLLDGEDEITKLRTAEKKALKSLETTLRLLANDLATLQND